MKKLFIAIAMVGLLSGIANAWPRYSYTTQPQFANTGDTAQGLFVLIDTGTPKAVYTTIQSPITTKFVRDRQISIQNYNSFNVYCGTSTSVFTYTTGARWIIQSSTTFTTQNTSSIFCTVDPAAGAGNFPIVGRIEYDSKD